MTIGNGDIASVLPERSDLLFFASGVSNSQERREAEYTRERELLIDQDIASHLVYFSTLAIFYSDTRYTEHKREMEQIIKNRFATYTIVRLGNISWGDNPNTLINFMKNKIQKGEQIEIQDTYRFIIDKEEFLYWVSLIPFWSCEMNLPGKRMLVKDIVDEYCDGILYPYANA